MPYAVNSDEEIEACFDVISELRPHLMRSEFLPLVRGMQAEGYRLACVKEGSQVVAVAGYRIFTTLFMGKNLYVDDLVTSDGSRSKGYGAKLISWLKNEARSSGCRFIHLDSGTQRHRAHGFYFAQGFSIASFHFSERLEGD